MTKEKIKRPGRQKRNDAEERLTAKERPTDTGILRSGIAITHRPPGTPLMKNCIEKGRSWEPNSWAMYPPRRGPQRNSLLTFMNLFGRPSESISTESARLISVGMDGHSLRYDLHLGDSAGTL